MRMVKPAQTDMQTLKLLTSKSFFSKHTVQETLTWPIHWNQKRHEMTLKPEHAQTHLMLYT